MRWISWCGWRALERAEARAWSLRRWRRDISEGASQLHHTWAQPGNQAEKCPRIISSLRNRRAARLYPTKAAPEQRKCALRSILAPLVPSNLVDYCCLLHHMLPAKTNIHIFDLIFLEITLLEWNENHNSTTHTHTHLSLPTCFDELLQ